MGSGRIELSYETTSNGATSATVRVTMTYYGNGETWNSSPSSNNCYITLNGTTKYFTHAYTTSTSAQTMGSADFTITKTHSTQSLTATGGITNYSTYYSNPTGSCTVSVSAKTSYTITYNRNGRGTLSKSTDTKWYGETLTLAAAPSNPGTGWTFVGWNTSSAATTAQYNASGSYTTNAKATLYAIWKKDITLTYNANNGSGAPASQTNTIYNTATSTSFTISSTSPTRSNYNFLGWADSGSTTVSYQPGGTISGVSDNKTIDAIWQVAYTPPKITSLVCYRSQSSSTSNSASDTGGYGIIKMSWSLGNDGNDLTTQIKIEYKLSTKTSWTTKLDWTNQNTSITSYSTYIGGTGSNALSEGQYDVRVSVRNSSYSSYATSKIDYISATFYVIDITEDGKGIGLLTTAPTVGINVSTAIKNLGASGLSATGTGGIAIGARSSTNTISSAGSGSIASGYAQGGSIEATTKGAFAGGLADGNNITASGVGSFAFGQSSNTAALTASGNGSIAMGLGCTSSGPFSLTHNMYTTASGRAQTVLGTWNIIDSATTSTHPTGISNLAQFKKYAFIIGNGTSDSARSNAFAVTWDGKVELNSEPLFKWTQIGSGSNTTNKITFSSATTNYNEIMVVASTERNGGYHLFSGILPAAIIDDTDREFKLSGGVGSTASTTCGAWGKIVKGGFTPVGVWINSTAFTSTTTWRIYGR